ncbi:hypothetical protein AN963_03815 [Brevibacillus choshinensis]|uniref:Helix-hairpin-helix DNA-binding motif class 1 domain-containing protein n=1 Tax=Brevibacillus choshinensis TaxID=54911 RepID=A0ABR5NC10_BRECH|nr:ComEA family DNA-binding protein [Brevibacillus choshinensis]KQL48926.1 hypothetical protein AN963_03815 [Brevibacillus choshinensis]
MLLEWWERYRRIILCFGAIFLIGSSLWLYQARSTEHAGMNSQLPLIAPAYASEESTLLSEDTPSLEVQKETTLSKPKETRTIDKEGTPPPMFVDVKGHVKQAGLYQLDTGMRVADAIAKAGGAKPDADLEQINLAALLTDGTAIVIPAKGDSQAAQITPTGLSPATYKPGGVSLSAPATDDSIQLNTATAEQLMSLPGIGEARAKAILRYREEKGPFRSPDELKEIEGIGDKMYDRIKDRIRIQ